MSNSVLKKNKSKINTCQIMLMLICVVPCSQVFAQDEAFMACANYSDRGQRIACLEDALESALEKQAPQATLSSDAPATQNSTLVVPAAAIITEETPATAEMATPQLQMEQFGKNTPQPNTVDGPEANIITDENGNEKLLASITELDKRQSLWIVTLSNGQTWKQQVAKNYNLRKGDSVSIFRKGFGNGFRLEADRLSGFIRVERLR